MKISLNLYNYVQRELSQLYAKRTEIKEAFSEAYELGDEVENAPLDAARFNLDMNESKIYKLEKAIYDVEAIDDIEANELVLGTKFRAKLIAENKEFIFVLSKEGIVIPAAATERMLSIDTDLGKSALGKGVGQTFSAITPKGERKYEIVEILTY